MAVGQYVFPFNTSGSEREGLTSQKSHLLETSTSCMCIGRSKTRATTFGSPLKQDDFDREDVLYDIRQVTLDYEEFDRNVLGQVHSKRSIRRLSLGGALA
jgi:hypothetical protein